MMYASSVAAVQLTKSTFRYVYQCYASANQDVFGGYQAVNRQRSIDISRKYDPGQVLQTMWPGYSRLGKQNGYDWV